MYHDSDHDKNLSDGPEETPWDGMTEEEIEAAEWERDCERYEERD